MLSCVWLFATPLTVACQAPLPWDSPGEITGVGCRALLQETIATQALNQCLLSLLHWQVGSLSLSHWRSTSIVQIPHLVCPFVSWWTLGLFPLFLWLWWIMLPGTFLHKALHGHMFSFLLDRYLALELLGLTINLYLIFYDTAKLFSKVVVPFYIPTSRACRVYSPSLPTPA